MGPNWGQQQRMQQQRQQQQRQQQQMQRQQKQMQEQMQRMREQQQKGYYWQQQQKGKTLGKVPPPPVNLDPAQNRINMSNKVQKKRGGCAQVVSFLMTLLFIAIAIFVVLGALSSF